MLFGNTSGYACFAAVYTKGFAVIQTNNKIQSLTPICMLRDIFGWIVVILMCNIQIEKPNSLG